MSIFRSRYELETIELANSSGLVFAFFQNGGLFRAMCHDVMINQILGNPLEGSLNNIYLRLRTADSITFVPLIGPSSPSTFAHTPHQARWQGHWQDLAYTCSLTLHPEATLWFWTIDIHNTASTDRLCDVIYTQDIGLAHEGAVRNNEAYCSHYIDHHVLTHDLIRTRRVFTPESSIRRSTSLAHAGEYHSHQRFRDRWSAILWIGV